MTEFLILIFLVYFSVVSTSCFCENFCSRRKGVEGCGWVSESGWGESFFFCRLTEGLELRGKLSSGVSCWHCCPSRAGIWGCSGHLTPAHRHLSVSWGWDGQSCWKLEQEPCVCQCPAQRTEVSCLLWIRNVKMKDRKNIWVSPLFASLQNKLSWVGEVFGVLYK